MDNIGEILLNMQKVEGPVSMIELEDVETALRHMNSRKVSVSTGVVVEMSRAGGKGCLG